MVQELSQLVFMAIDVLPLRCWRSDLLGCVHGLLENLALKKSSIRKETD